MLFIAEKPDVAKAIVKALGGNFSSKDGFMTDGKVTVTWCFGHMMQLKDPEDYDEKYKYWRLEDLPFVFIPYQRKSNPKTAAQLKVIKSLIKEADTIIHAGDVDDEGQLLVDEILREVKNKKPVKRLLAPDTNIKAMQRSIANMGDNSQYEHWGFQAEARTVADQLLGYNLTRSYTIKHRAVTGERDVISIGRVQSAVLGLVVRRCREYANHKKSYYYNLTGQFIIDNADFKAKFITTEKQKLDSSKRLIDEAEVKKIAAACKDKPATVISSVTEEKIRQHHYPLI
jgi:DNA topoisomerase-3